MPRLGDYSKCKIYKITSMNNPELVYYGHTCDTLSRRFSKHKGPSNNATSKMIIEKDDAIILLVEDYPCESEDQARSREGFYVLNNQCVNKNVPGRTNKESVKAYQNKHRDQILEYKKQYNKSNKDKQKLYRDTNQEHIKERQKKYRELHKEELNEKARLLYLKKKAEKRI